jgi:hypothetical protein
MSLSISGQTAPPSLTIYNEGFAAIRETVPLDLKPGLNEARYSGATRQLEPESVILRDPSGKVSFQILEQNYRNDVASQGLLLSLFEGQTISFQTGKPEDPKTVSGRILRSGYEPGGSQTQPLLEVDGKLVFQLPGLPLFPALPDNTILQPTLSWILQSPAAARFTAELAYISNGFRWNADYNLVLEENQDTGDFLGWVSIHNESGKVFPAARIQLMAGDVNRVRQPAPSRRRMHGVLAGAEVVEAPIEEKSFDEFHLYTLAHPATLLDKQTKQVEFVRAERINTKRLYIYDPNQGNYWFGDDVQTSPQYGLTTSKKIDVYREFDNKKENRLGIALPKGRIRVYTREASTGSLQFTGENTIDHTPQGERIRIFTGNAFDLVGERKQTDFRVLGERRLTESFEIRLRNRKQTPAAIRVVERLYRGTNWKLLSQSDPHIKTGARTIEFAIPLQPDQERVVTFTVEYRW